MTQMNEVKEFLEHVGVKGMKWGVRRKRGSNGRVSTERKRVDQINTKVKTHGKKSLTNKDLADYNKRLEMETKFEKFRSGQMSGGQKAVAAGAAFVGGMLLNSGRQHAQRYVNKAVADTLKGTAARSAARRAARAAASRAEKTAARHTPIRSLMLNP